MKYFVDIHNYTIILCTRADYQFHLVFGGFEGQEQSILVRLLKTTKFNLLLSIMDDGSLIGGGGGSGYSKLSTNSPDLLNDLF